METVGLRDAARHLGRSESWIRRNMYELGIPFYKIGARYQFVVAELDEWFATCHRKGTKAKKQSAWANLAS
jgi:hypothetical protein